MKAFVDASVVLAALGSKSGGSSEVLKLTREKKVEGTTSQAVVEEVLRNISKIKVSVREATNLILSSGLNVSNAPKQEEVEKYMGIVAEKDAHIVASAIASKSEYIITLDKKHLVSRQIKGLKISTPGEFLKILTKSN